MLTGNEFMVKTIVTSELPADIATRAGIKIYDVLTGFKFIGAKILELEGVEQFIAGGEESYGYMIGDFVRDKDAVAACSMIAEIAAWARENGKPSSTCWWTSTRSTDSTRKASSAWFAKARAVPRRYSR